MERSEEKRAKKEIIKEHITVFSEAASKYLGHLVPASGAAKDTANGILAFCAEKQIDVTKIDFIVCDGTNANVGWNLTTRPSEPATVAGAVVYIMHAVHTSG